METKTQTNNATMIHLSLLTQYFIPFGNYIIPLLIWSSKKNDSIFIDRTGKHALNFQLSILLYSIVLVAIFVPCFLMVVFNTPGFDTVINRHHFSISNFNLGENSAYILIGLLLLLALACIKIAEFFLIIYAASKTANGEMYRYPATIPFLK